MTAQDLPRAITELVDLLISLPGARAVVLGGSGGQGSRDAASDWDLGVYYRGTLELAALESYGTVHPPGSWGRLMNGGAWLKYEGEKVDVLLRDLDAVDYWNKRAVEGRYDVDFVLGYLAGLPTYSLWAELASCQLLRGEVPAAEPFPSALSVAAPPRWRFHRWAHSGLELCARRAVRPGRRRAVPLAHQCAWASTLGWATRLSRARMDVNDREPSCCCDDRRVDVSTTTQAGQWITRATARSPCQWRRSSQRGRRKVERSGASTARPMDGRGVAGSGTVDMRWRSNAVGKAARRRSADWSRALLSGAGGICEGKPLC